MSESSGQLVGGALEAQTNLRLIDEATTLAKGKADYASTKVAQLEGRLPNCPPEHLSLLLYEIESWSREFHSWQVHVLEFSDFEDIMNNASPLRVEGTKAAYNQSVTKAKRLLGVK